MNEANVHEMYDCVGMFLRPHQPLFTGSGLCPAWHRQAENTHSRAIVINAFDTLLTDKACFRSDVRAQTARFGRSSVARPLHFVSGANKSNWSEVAAQPGGGAVPFNLH